MQMKKPPRAPLDVTLSPKRWLAELPSHLRGSRKPSSWFGGEKPLKSLLSTQTRSEPLRAGQDEAVAPGQMGKDQRACSGGGRVPGPELREVQGNFPPSAAE